MKKIITVSVFSLVACIGYGQDNMNKKMDNPTDKMNKKMDNKTDKMNKNTTDKLDTASRKTETTGDSLQRMTPGTKTNSATGKGKDLISR